MAIGEHGEEITISMEEAMAKVRSTRDSMLEMYVDYYQSKPLLWNDLTAEQQQELADENRNPNHLRDHNFNQPRLQLVKPPWTEA